MALRFYFNGHTYQILLSGKTWSAAKTYAQSQDGHLATVGSSGENTAIYSNATASVSLASAPEASDGGGAVYLWLGASDIAAEGSWTWVDSTAVSTYTNWGSGTLGSEPDNYLGNQDAMGMGLEAWPQPGGGIGVAGKWNDVNAGNVLYSVIEWDYLRGTSGADSVVGTAGNDRLLGLAGNDTLNGGAGRDSLDGGTGNDKLDGGTGNDVLEGGSGNDTLIGDAGMDTVTYARATAAVTAFKPTGESSTGGANDGMGGTDVIHVGAADILRGSNFDDTLTGSPRFLTSWNEWFGDDEIWGGKGNDTISGLDGDDYLYGEAGNDRLNGGAGENELRGGAGNDTLDGTGGTSCVTYDDSPAAVSVNLATGVVSDGWGGTDSLISIRQVIGSGFNDTLTGNGGANDFMGNAGNDSIIGGAGFDVVYFDAATSGVTLNLAAGTASDGMGGTDTLSGVEGAEGSGFGDRLTGNSSANRLLGIGGADTLTGSGGNDTLLGGAGNDTLIGGLGNDILTGGTGLDIFRFNSIPNASTNKDTLTDFNVNDDTIQLENSGTGLFTSLATGALAAGAFHSGAGMTTATEADDRIIYNTTTGALYYDADGSGSASSAIQFASVGTTTHAALTHADFVVI